MRRALSFLLSAAKLAPIPIGLFLAASRRLAFPVALRRAEGGGWLADCPTIPGCATQGRDLAGTLITTREAIALCLETRAAEGRTWSPPDAAAVVELDAPADLEPGAPAEAPREALGRATVPVLGPVDLELALGRPIRVDLDQGLLDLEPGGGLIARIPQLPTAQIRRLRIDLVHGTVHADADAIGPFLLRGIGSALRLVLRRALGWQPGRSVAALLAQNLPLDPYSGARRVYAGPLGASAWLHPDARVSVELRADRAEAALTHAVVVRVLGLALPILAVRLLFGEARLQIDPGPAGPVRRALLRFVAWAATGWLRRRMPAAMTIPGYDLFADEQRRARLVELVRRLRGRLFARFVAPARLHALARQLALPEPGVHPPAPPPAPGVVVWERALAGLGPIKVSLDAARTLHVSLDRGGARIDLGKGATVRAHELGLDLTLRAVSLSFMPWTVELETTPPAGELELHALSHALRTLFAEFMRYFWPSDRSPKAGHDTLLSLGADRPWGPLKVCVARGGAIDLRLDREGLSLRSTSGLFVTGEAIDWLPDFYLHELALRSATTAVKLAISGIQEQHYREAAPVSPITEAVLSHLLRVLVLPKLPEIWRQRLGLPRVAAPPMPTIDASRVVAFAATLPGDYGELLVSMDAGDTITVRASDAEVSIESTRGLQATMPALRLAIQLRGARYHLQSGEVQIGGLGQLENALIEAVLRRQAAARGAGGEPGTSGVRAMIDRLPTDDRGRVIVFQHRLVKLLLQQGTVIRMTLDDGGLRVVAEPPLSVDGPARMNYSVSGVHCNFNEARFEIDVDGDTAFAEIFEGLLDKQVERRLNERLLPLLPAVMRRPGYRLTTDPRARDTIAELIQSFARTRRSA